MKLSSRVTIVLAVIFTLITMVGGFILLNPYHDDLSLLETAHEQVTIEGRIYRLETYLWRDLGPSFSPDTSRMIALIKVIPNDTLPFQSNIDADHIWVINGEEIWSSKFSGENIPQDENHLEKIARNGPKWETGITVDVFIQLVVNSDTYLLKASDQLIHRIS